MTKLQKKICINVALLTLSLKYWCYLHTNPAVDIDMCCIDHFQACFHTVHTCK